jgi:hypothetical protein
MNIQAFSDSLIERAGIYFAAEIAEIAYPEHGNKECFELEEQSFWFRHRNDCITEALRRYATQKTFFDIGGGNGFVAKRLQDEGFSCILVEPGLTGARNARERNVSHVVCATLETAGIKPGSIPAAGLFDVLEHIEHDLVFLKSLQASMQTAGLLVLTVPAYQTLWSQEDKDAQHFRRYTRASIGKVLVSAGFEPVYSTYIFSILPPAIFAIRSLPYRLGLTALRKKPGRVANEHRQSGGIATRLCDQVWAWELAQIRRGMSVSFGGSCLVVATKV